MDLQYLQDYDYKHDIDFLSSALENVHFFRALYFIKVKVYEMAIKDFTSIIEIDKFFAEAYYYRGICKGMFDDEKGGTYDIKAAATTGVGSRPMGNY